MCLEGDYPHLSKPPTPPLLSKQLSVALPWLGLLLKSWRQRPVANALVLEAFLRGRGYPVVLVLDFLLLLACFGRSDP